MAILPIGAAKHLMARLGKARTDRIRYHQQGTGKRQSAATNLINPLVSVLEWQKYPSWEMECILAGYAGADDGRIPLNTRRLFGLFQCLPIINTHEIQRMTGLGERQAQRYLRAAKGALPYLVRAAHGSPESIDAPEQEVTP